MGDVSYSLEVSVDEMVGYVGGERTREPAILIRLIRDTDTGGYEESCAYIPKEMLLAVLNGHKTPDDS